MKIVYAQLSAGASGHPGVKRQHEFRIQSGHIAHSGEYYFRYLFAWLSRSSSNIPDVVPGTIDRGISTHNQGEK